MGLRESEAKIASLEASLASLESEDILQKEAIVKQIEEIRQTAYTHIDAWDRECISAHGLCLFKFEGTQSAKNGF